MIISANKANDFISSVKNLYNCDPFACRIISLYNSYSPALAFVDYWMTADDISGRCTGAVARNGSSFILLLSDETNLDEVSSFMRVAGASSAICDAKYKLDIFGSKSVTGSILVRNSAFENIDNTVNIITPDIKSAYDLIVECADENFRPPAYENFYVDINHKLRHNTMRMYGVVEDDVLAAVAMTVAESDNGAVLGAVACSPDYRRCGYGSTIVKYISNRLIEEDKAVFLHRAKNANVSFYNNLGFTEAGKWREYYIEG